jgi:hypothetical protein
MIARRRRPTALRLLGLASLTVATLVALVGLDGCSSAREPLLTELRDAPRRHPVVLIPGITGSQLRDRESGEVHWGNTKRLFFPKDGGYMLAVHVEDPLAEAARIEAFAPILQLRVLGLFKKEIYGSLLRLMERNGYQRGELSAPRSGDDFFFFDYDWRLGTEQAIRGLAEQLEALHRARGEQLTRVTLIGQSNAALIARYFVKYGAASLEQAEAGVVALPRGVVVDKLILVGTSNGGSLRVLHEMNHGRRYVPPVGRRVRQETLFAFPSMFESLPIYEPRLFFGESGELLDVDLFDAANWERYEWSIYGPTVRKRLSRPNLPPKFGDADARRAYLERRLNHSRRLHRLLQADPPSFEPPRYYLIQNAFRGTGERALLVKKQDRWRTLFHDDGAVRNDPYLRSLAEAPGDGHATLRSQNWLSPREREAVARPTAYIEGGHFEIILEPPSHRRILDDLLD